MAEEEYAELNLVDQSNTDPDIPRQIPINGQIRLGRVDHVDYADVAIKSAKFEAMVSRKHATIKKNKTGWIITDNRSTNGVLVNGLQIPADVAYPLKDGDVVTFGTDQSDLVYTFEVNRRKPGIGVQEKANKEMQKLKQAHEQGWLRKEEYDEQKAAVQNYLPAPKWMQWDKTPRRCADIAGMSESQLRSGVETAFKYVYNFREREWQKTVAMVAIEPQPFDEGAMRSCYRMKDFSFPEGQNNYVAKTAKEQTSQHTYFADVEMQGLCQYFSEEFNKHSPPKKVDFIEAAVIELIDRPGRPIFAVERYLKGKYQKHNNNFGFVSPDDRNTPQAFSHFTYSYSSGFFLVCDIQGVGDVYTDPQVHSKDQVGFGKGNLGVKGINRFFATHECNSICEHLGIDTKRKKVNDIGTKPPPKMDRPRSATGGGPSSDAVYNLNTEELEFLSLRKSDLEGIVKYFKKYDRSGSGYIMKPDLVGLCKDLDHKIDTQSLNRVKVDGEGKIQFRQFLAWWRGVEI